jgi:hypothetical protein
MRASAAPCRSARRIRRRRGRWRRVTRKLGVLAEDARRGSRTRRGESCSPLGPGRSPPRRASRSA